MERTESEGKDKAIPPAKGRVAGGPLSLLLPPDKAVLAEARRMIGDPSTRIEDLAVCASQDPVLVIEILRVANAMFFAESRSQMTSVKAAAIRLGADSGIETFDKLGEREQIGDSEVSRWLEIHRARCKRASIVATIFAEALARPLSEECQVAGLFLFVGEMLAVQHLQERYTKLANESSRSAVLFRLSQDYRIDVESLGLNYLRKHGVPDPITAILDRESRIKSVERAVMKPICWAAGELVDAFDQNRLDKLAPGKIVPPKSALRLLQMTDQQYLKIYERVAEFLFSFKLLEERKKDSARRTSEAIKAPTQAAPKAQSKEQSELQSEIQSLLSGAEVEDDEFADDEIVENEKDKAPDRKATTIAEVDSKIGSNLEQFNIRPDSNRHKTVARVVPTEEKKTEAPKIHTKKGSQFLDSVSTMLDDAKNSEELLSQILAKLVKPGPFEKAALIVVSKDRKTAIVVACRGPTFGGGQTLQLDDPLNPLAQCLSKVQSFGRKNNNISPFGSKAFAVSPIDADHDTPVALYADCGENGALTFESRRIFRNVVEILNQKLPTLPGGIPVEIKGG